MHHHVAEIRDDPLARGKAVDGHCFHTMFLLQTSLEIAGQRFEVRFRGARGDEEKIRERRDAPQVEDEEILRLFVVEDAGAEPDECFRIQGALGG